MCGEHLKNMILGLRRAGSSPRVRGTREAELRAAAREGIIPACAGNTCPGWPGWSPTGDHPRVCGEHKAFANGEQDGSGSSPRVRGTLHVVAIAQDRCGIIPACAGNTGRLPSNVAPHGDHPRVCGEHAGVAQPGQVEPGSSPRVRGTLPFTDEQVSASGIIPACAGNTS